MTDTILHRGMLVLTLRPHHSPDDTVIIHGTTTDGTPIPAIAVTILANAQNGDVRIGVRAERSIAVDRLKIYHRKLRAVPRCQPQPDDEVSNESL